MEMKHAEQDWVKLVQKTGFPAEVTARHTGQPLSLGSSVLTLRPDIGRTGYLELKDVYRNSMGQRI